MVSYSMLYGSEHGMGQVFKDTKISKKDKEKYAKMYKEAHNSFIKSIEEEFE